MKKLAILLMVLAFTLGAGSAFALEVQAGALVEGVTVPVGSLDARVDFGPVTAEAAFGFATFSLNNPVIFIDGEEQEMPWDNLELKAHALLAQVGVYGNWWRPPNMVVYSGLRGGMGFLGGSFNLQESGTSYIWDGSTWDYYDYTYTMDVGLSGLCLNIKLVALGWDFQIPGVPNAVFSVGVGAQKWWFLNAKADLSMSESHEYYGDYSESVEFKLEPGIGGFSSFVEIGARVALGRKG